MEKNKIVTALKDYNPQDVERFANYIIRLSTEKEKDTGKLKNEWILYKKEEQLAELFKRVNEDNLVFDGVHITLQNTGISYDYVAYKNKMLLAYPESVIDLELVYEGDSFEVSKNSGTISYVHTIKDVFKRSEKNIVGGYCIIKNKRGESITTLNKEDIEKHRKLAKTDSIWRNWITEMSKKTVMKKACKTYYQDIYEAIEAKDNENYELENPIDIEIELKTLIDDCKNIEEVTALYNKCKTNVTNMAAFNKAITMKKKELSK